MDRRSSPRIPLDAPCLVSLIDSSGQKFPAMVVDVSIGGVQLALSPGQCAGKFEPGDDVYLQDVYPPVSKILEGVQGKIAWTGGNGCGIRLNMPLPLDAAEFAATFNL